MTPLALNFEVKPTSLEAWRSILDSLPAARRAVWRQLALNPAGLTGRELDAQLTGLGGRGHGHKRLPELQRVGLARVRCVRPCRISGRPAEVWEAAVTSEPFPVEPRRSLRQRVSDLVARFESSQQPWTGPEVAHAIRREIGAER